MGKEDVYHLFVQVYRQVHQRVCQGLSCMCVITKADMVDDKVAKNTASVCKSEVVDNMRTQVAQAVGLDKNQVCSARPFSQASLNCSHFEERHAVRAKQLSFHSTRLPVVLASGITTRVFHHSSFLSA